LAVRRPRELAALYLNNDYAFTWMDEQNVKFAHTRSLARSVGDIKVMGDGPTSGFKLTSERNESSPLTLIREG
jgi:hypothetical protein